MIEVKDGRLTMRRPDNWHNHFRHRGDPRFIPTVRYIASQFGRATAMGNLPTPILTAEQMVQYRDDIRWAAVTSGCPSFQPLMVVMLSQTTTPHLLEQAFHAGAYGVKDMPANGTTNSAHGIYDRQAPLYRDCLKVTSEYGKAWLGHCEVPMQNGQVVPLALRSKLFVPILQRMRDDFPDLRMCVEHIDIAELVDLVVWGGNNICATVTPHHLMVTAAEADADRHCQCMPYPKTPDDIAALLQVVLSGHPRFFYGSDNAPHLLPAKLAEPPASGVFTAPVELGVMADLFEQHHALHQFEPFMSELGALWHGLPFNEGTVTLERDPHPIPEVIDLGDGHQIVPYKHGQNVNWRLAV